MKQQAAIHLRSGFGERVRRDFKQHWMLYLMALPMIAFYLLFHYQPMYGATIASRISSPSCASMAVHGWG